jgi:hypothetical protein
MMHLPRTASRLRLPLAALLLIGLTALPADADEGFAFNDRQGESLDIVLDGRVVARYMYAYDTDRLSDTYKPYLHVMDAEGNQPITKGPGGQFPHHRGIFIGYPHLTVGGRRYDLWHMSGGPQVHQEFVDQQASQDQASFTSLVHWNAKDGSTLLKERRTFVFHRQPAPALVQIDTTSELKAVAGDALLHGDPEHAGVQYRPADEVDRAKSRYLYPESKDPRKDRDLDWAALAYVLDGKTYSAVQMNHPDNPAGTVWSAYRDYGRFGAFPKTEIAEGETLTLRYRFRVMTGELPDREQIQDWQEEYAGS